MTEREAIQQQRWQALADHLNKWFYKLDLEALRVALSAAHAHYQMKHRPVWLFITGPKSSGKTEAMHCLKGFREPGQQLDGQGTKVYELGRFTNHSLLSGYERRGKAGSAKTSLLNLLGESIIFLMPDFWTLASVRDDVRNDIAAEFLRVWDGDYDRKVGNLPIPLHWKGKATIIANSTPELERDWAIFNKLGNRFVTIRWHTGDPEEQALRALDQLMGDEKEIRATSTRLARQFIIGAQTATPPTSQEARELSLHKLGSLVAQTRRSIRREFTGAAREADEAEMPSRIIMAMGQVATAHAGLFGRATPGQEDIQVGRRLGFDSIPQRRRTILESLYDLDNTTFGELIELTGLSSSSLRWNLSELAELGLVDTGKSDYGENYVRLPESVRQMWRAAKLL